LRGEKKQERKNAAGDPHAAHLLADLRFGAAHVLQKSIPWAIGFLAGSSRFRIDHTSRSSDYTSIKWQNPFVA
jgi:hypothetical protein